MLIKIIFNTLNITVNWRRGSPMFSKRVLFFETDYINIQCSLYIFDLKWNYISNVHFPVSPCCYFTSFEIITAREKSPLHLDRRFWKISPILEVKDNLENFEIFQNFGSFSKFRIYWKFSKISKLCFVFKILEFLKKLEIIQKIENY